MSLKNENTAACFYSSGLPVKASILVRNGLEHLVDGNKNGALRGIGTPSDYTMGDYAVALGIGSRATGAASLASGRNVTASADSAHAEGSGTAATNRFSHAEGANSIASAESSHAEGAATLASGDASHAQGINTTASGLAAHAEGVLTSTNGYMGAHIMGLYGNADAPYSWFLANGTSPAAPGLAAMILGNGHAYIDVEWHNGGADYAEMFETMDGEPIEPGCFVTLGAGETIRKATNADAYLLGVTAAVSGVVGNAGALRWKDKYLTDEWGRIQYHEVEAPAVIGKNGATLVPPRKEVQPMLNPAWDAKQQYIPREERPEWVRVGLLGRLLVRDDGTCVPGGYCMPNSQSVAAAAPSGYRVLGRTSENQVIMLK